MPQAAQPLLAFAALATAVTALWVRRKSWHSRWEAPATLAVGLQSVYIIAMIKPLNPIISEALYDIFGVWNVEELFSVWLYLGGLATIAMMFASRLVWEPGELCLWMRWWLLLPTAIFAPAQAATFTIASLRHGYVLDLNQLAAQEPGKHPSVYTFWLLCAVAAMYVISLAIWALTILLRDDKRATGIIVAYLGALCISAACWLATLAGASPTASWIAPRLEVISYAGIALYSWRHKTAWARGLIFPGPCECDSDPQAHDLPCPHNTGLASLGYRNAGSQGTEASNG